MKENQGTLLLLLTPFSAHCSHISKLAGDTVGLYCFFWAWETEVQSSGWAKPRVCIWWVVKTEVRTEFLQVENWDWYWWKIWKRRCFFNDNMLLSCWFCMMKRPSGPRGSWSNSVTLRKLSLSFVCSGCLSSQPRPEWIWWSLGEFDWRAAGCPLQVIWACSQGCGCPAQDLHQPLQTFNFWVSLSQIEPPPFRLMMVNSTQTSKGRRNWVKLLTWCVCLTS